MLPSFNDCYVLVEAEGVDIKVSGKRETMEELKVKAEDGEAGDGDGEENGEENEKDGDKDGKADDDEESKKLPKYSPGIPVGG